MAITRIGNPAIADVRGVNFRNIIINGDMSLSQRSNSTASITGSGYHTVDRFYTDISNGGTWTQSQSTDVPSGQGFAKSLKMDCTTADTSLLSTDRILIYQRFEGQNLQYLKKGTSSAESLTLSFWVKSNKTGTYIAELYDTDNTRQISKSYTINSASTWEKKTLTFAGDTSGALDNDNQNSLAVNFWLGAGTFFSSGTLNTSWNSITEANRVVGNVNLADSTSNEWYITGVQLEASDTASDFEFLPFDVNLQRCQRYLPAYIGTNNNFRLPGAGISSGSTVVYLTLNHPVTTRVKPTGVVVSSAGHWSGGVDGIVVNQAMGSVAYNLSSTFATRLAWTVASGTPFTNGVPAYIEGTNTSAVLYLTGCEL